MFVVGILAISNGQGVQNLTPENEFWTLLEPSREWPGPWHLSSSIPRISQVHWGLPGLHLPSTSTVCAWFFSAQTAFILTGWDNSCTSFKPQVRSHVSWKPCRRSLPAWVVKFTVLCVPRSVAGQTAWLPMWASAVPPSPRSLVCKMGPVTSTL